MNYELCNEASLFAAYNTTQKTILPASEGYIWKSRLLKMLQNTLINLENKLICIYINITYIPYYTTKLGKKL